MGRARTNCQFPWPGTFRLFSNEFYGFCVIEPESGDVAFELSAVISLGMACAGFLFTFASSEDRGRE
jgi:hypothetical protein